MPSIESSIVEVAVVRPGRDGRECLVLQRASGERLYPGLWQIVSGKIRAGETAVQAAKREVLEETGLTPRAWWAAPDVNVFYTAATDVVHLCPLFVAEAAAESRVTLSSEHQSYLWTGWIEARKLLVWPASRRLLQFMEQDLWNRPELERWTRLPAE